MSTSSSVLAQAEDLLPIYYCQIATAVRTNEQVEASSTKSNGIVGPGYRYRRAQTSESRRAHRGRVSLFPIAAGRVWLKTSNERRKRNGKGTTTQRIRLVLSSHGAHIYL